jgi:hypothetical protein
MKLNLSEEKEKIKREMEEYGSKLKAKAEKERIKLIRERQLSRLTDKYKRKAEWEAKPLSEKLSDVKKNLTPAWGYIQNVANKQQTNMTTKPNTGFSSLPTFNVQSSFINPGITGQVPNPQIRGKTPNPNIRGVRVNNSAIPSIPINFGAIDRFTAGVSGKKPKVKPRYK